MTQIDNDDDMELTPEEEALAQRLMNLQHRLHTTTDDMERWTILGELIETGCFKLRMSKSDTEVRPDQTEILRIRLIG